MGKLVLEFLEKRLFRYGVCVSVSSVYVCNRVAFITIADQKWNFVASSPKTWGVYLAKSWVKSTPVRYDKEQRKNSIPWLSFAKHKKEIYRSGFCPLFFNFVKAGVIFLGLLWQAVGILYRNLISNLDLHIEGFLLIILKVLVDVFQLLNKNRRISL